MYTKSFQTFIFVFLGVLATQKSNADETLTSEAASGAAPTCRSAVKGIDVLAGKVTKRINTLLSKIYEINTLEELKSVHSEVEGYQYTWKQRVELQKRISEPFENEAEVSALANQAQSLFSNLVKAIAASPEEFSISYIKALLLHSTDGLSDTQNNFKTLVEGVHSKGSVDFNKIKQLATIAAQLQKFLWIPDSTRAQLALIFWNKKQELPQDPLSLLPLIFKNLPVGYPKVRLIGDYLKVHHSDSINQNNLLPIASQLVSVKGLTEASVAEFFKIFVQIREKFYADSAISAKVAGRIWTQEVSLNDLVANYQFFRENISAKKSQQLLSFTLDFMISNRTGITKEAVVTFFRAIYQKIGDSASARRIVIMGVKSDEIKAGAEKYLQPIQDLYSIFRSVKEVGIVMGPIIESKADAVVIQRAMEVAKQVVANDKISYNGKGAITASMVQAQLTDTQITLVTDIYLLLKQTKDIYSTDNIVKLTRAAIMLDPTLEVARKLRQEFEKNKDEGASNTSALNWSISTVSQEFKKSLTPQP